MREGVGSNPVEEFFIGIFDLTGTKYTFVQFFVEMQLC